MDPLPYNITINSQSAAIVYTPSRNGNDTLEGGWNVMYTDGTAQNVVGRQGVGDSYLQTKLFGASMSITWIGTAAYIYGNSTAPYYTLVDGALNIGPRVPQSNLLASVTGLPYGSHTIILAQNGTDLLGFHHAILTIGIGYEGYDITFNQSVPAVINDRPNDAFFDLRKLTTYTSWGLEPAELEEVLPNSGHQPVPRAVSGVLESTNDPSLVFKITNSSAFFVRGYVAPQRQSKMATLTPGLNGEPFKVTVFNDYSSILDFDQVLYWESGLNRDQTYTVAIRASGSVGLQRMDFHTLDIIDGGPNPSKGTLGETSSSAANQLSAGSIGGIVVGVVLSVLIIIILVLRCRRGYSKASNITAFVETRSDYPRHRGSDSKSKRSPNHESEPEDAPPSPSLESNTPPGVSAGLTSHALRHLRRIRWSFAPPAPIRETDAGPATLPPEYDHSWIVNASAPVSASPRRVLPILPGPGPGSAPPIPRDKIEHDSSEQTTDPSSS
uniref:Transmembrane protein n=1 Tax=Moniliophthora roreri TaxID=221103 RepID=A0A0W0ETZ1_MONRR